MTSEMTHMLSVLAQAPVVPVLTVTDIAHAAPLAEALHNGGVRLAEVTLRTPIALDVIREMKAAVPSLLVGAGTILSVTDLHNTLEAGSDFSVSPGAFPKLASAMLASGVPAFPGVATASEAMQRADDGFEVMKFFPAENIGGAPALKALTAPLAALKFMPTGGVSPDNMQSYLSIPNVVAVGGGWIAKPADLKGGDWAGITTKSRAAISTALS